MSDLVERLRQASERGMKHEAGPVRAYCDAITLSEAAAEIERLTAALASEREACALVADEEERMCEEQRNERPRDSYHWSFWERSRKSASSIASAIRARGKEI